MSVPKLEKCYPEVGAGSQSNQEKRTETDMRPFVVEFVSQNSDICRITFNQYQKMRAQRPHLLVLV